MLPRLLGYAPSIAAPKRAARPRDAAPKPRFVAKTQSRQPAFKLVGLLLVLEMGLTVTLPERENNVQVAGQWSRPVVIYETAEGGIRSPVLVADKTGRTHAFWWVIESSSADPDQEMQAIYYARESDGEWSTPVDILVSNGARFPTAAIDPSGSLHVLWQGSLNQYFTSRASVEVALSARAWSPPVALGSGNIRGQITADNLGSLHVVYPGPGSEGVYYQVSSDRGEIWSSASNVSSTRSQDASADWARASVGVDGNVHVVWTEFRLPNGWPPTGVYYSRSDDGGATWTNPEEIAGEGYDQISIAIAGDETVHVVWNGMAGIDGRYHRLSTDGGRTWSEIAMITARGATSGPPQIAVDSSETLHLLTSFDGCAQYASWQPEKMEWTQLQCISGADAMASGWIEEPALTVVGGNRVHAMFWDNQERLWHTALTTSAPPVSLAAYTSDHAGEILDPLEGTVPNGETPGFTTSYALAIPMSRRNQSVSPGRSLLVGLVPAALIVAGTLAAVTVLRRRS